MCVFACSWNICVKPTFWLGFLGLIDFIKFKFHYATDYQCLENPTDYTRRLLLDEKRNRVQLL